MTVAVLDVGYRREPLYRELNKPMTLFLGLTNAIFSIHADLKDTCLQFYQNVDISSCEEILGICAFYGVRPVGSLGINQWLSG